MIIMISYLQHCSLLFVAVSFVVGAAVAIAVPVAVAVVVVVVAVAMVVVAVVVLAAVVEEFFCEQKPAGNQVKQKVKSMMRKKWVKR